MNNNKTEQLNRRNKNETYACQVGLRAIYKQTTYQNKLLFIKEIIKTNYISKGSQDKVAWKI